MKRATLLLILLVLISSLIACQQQTEEESTPAPTTTRITGTLVPYETKVSSDITKAPEQSVPTLAPSPSPTPQVHVVSLGETMISIAYNYGITLEALQNANPEANPYAMIVGDELLIPYQAPVEEGSTAPAPDPEPVELSEAQCYPEASGGVWCLWTATNPLETGTENILVEIQIKQDDRVISQVVTAPVNISAAGQRVPMGAFFSAEERNGLSAPFKATLTLLQALPLNNNTARYVPIELQDGLVSLKADRTIAAITGSIALEQGVTTEATSVWVVAAAFGSDGQLVGFRRWTQEAPLRVGERIALEMQVFALGNETIESVEFLLEAHP